MPARIGPRIIAAIILITCVAVAFHLLINYRADCARVESDLGLVARSVVPDLALSIWNYDREQIRVQLEALDGLPRIERVVLSLAEEPEGGPMAAGKVEAARTVELEYPVELAVEGQQKTALGTLRLVVSLDPLLANLKAQLVQILLFQAGSTFVLSAVILWLLYSLLLRHVMAIANYAQNTSVDTLDRVLTLDRRTPPIDDLLEFSRTSRAPLARQKIAMRELVEAAWSEARESSQRRDAELVLREMPDAQVDRTLLMQVLVNPLGNACKYAHPGRPARVEAVWDGEAWFVKDNGVGFDMKYAGKLFGVFQRLHDAGSYEGTGIGLAIVRRIIERHGGRVWARGVPGEGATFWFTLGESAA